MYLLSQLTGRRPGSLERITSAWDKEVPSRVRKGRLFIVIPVAEQCVRSQSICPAFYISPGPIHAAIGQIHPHFCYNRADKAAILLFSTFGPPETFGFAAFQGAISDIAVFSVLCPL